MDAAEVLTRAPRCQQTRRLNWRNARLRNTRLTVIFEERIVSDEKLIAEVARIWADAIAALRERLGEGEQQ